jgi:hypothetical protein
MAIEDFLSGVQHGDANAAYSDKGVAGPQDKTFEGAGASTGGGIGEKNESGMGSSSGPIGTQAQV